MGQRDIGSLPCLRLDHSNPRIPRKIRTIESEDMRNTVYVHRGHKPRIVGLLPRHAVCQDEPAPFWIDIIRVRQSKNRIFDARNNPVCLGRSEPESVIFHWPRGNSPQLDEILRANKDTIALFAKPRYRITGLAILRMRAMKPAKNDVGVGQNVRYRFQSSSRV